jgi:transcriptional regulator with XRE-family HTH domain
MGRRQRHSEFIGLSPAEVARIARDKRTPTAVRLEALAELKYWGARNRQKRSK